MKKREVTIFCPKCSWEPRPESRWFCAACAHRWNTFETAATCPECGKVHQETQCLACHGHSPHPDWYHEFNHLEDEAVTVEAVGAEI